MRISLFEFEDLPWFPNVVRQGMTDYLRYLLTWLNMYDPVVPLLREVLDKTKENRVVDLCSGGGGAIEALSKQLSSGPDRLKIILTDIFPNRKAYELIKVRSCGRIDFFSMPVDAALVPQELKGVRTMFSAFHHFEPEKAAAILKDAVQNKAPVAFFDGGDRNLLTMAGILFVHPVAFLLLTPFFRPFRFSRIFFTYLVPLIPLCTIWDGLVSIVRLYSPGQMLKLARKADSGKYRWRSGLVRGKTGFRIAYLIGWPKEEGNEGMAF